MKKLLFLTITILLLPLSAKYVDSGAIMCNNLNSIIKLKNAINTSNFWNVWDEVTSTHTCGEVAYKMSNKGLIFEDMHIELNSF